MINFTLKYQQLHCNVYFIVQNIIALFPEANVLVSQDFCSKVHYA